MLSRVADNLYWMSRYLERVIHTTRLIDVNLHQRLDQTMEDEQIRWQRLRASLHATIPDSEEGDSAYNITRSLTFDASDNVSIVHSISAARENARQVRELISSEMWEQINRLYLEITHTTIDDIWYTEPHKFFANVKDGVNLFRGITDATMNHSEGWHFISLGRYIERASATATLLDVHFQAFFNPEQEEDPLNGLDHQNYLGWVGLLRSCTAFEAYCKVYTAAHIRPESIAEFLLFNPESPRSLRFASRMIQSSLQAIAKATGTRYAGRVERLAGRFRSIFEYDQVEDMIHSTHSYLENVQRQCTQINNAIYQVYIVYPIDVALPERGAAQA
jgi:uncharacterized alpha-E superfamily protein